MSPGVQDLHGSAPHAPFLSILTIAVPYAAPCGNLAQLAREKESLSSPQSTENTKPITPIKHYTGPSQVRDKVFHYISVHVTNISQEISILHRYSLL